MQDGDGANGSGAEVGAVGVHSVDVDEVGEASGVERGCFSFDAVPVAALLVVGALGVVGQLAVGDGQRVVGVFKVAVLKFSVEGIVHTYIGSDIESEIV